MPVEQIGQVGHGVFQAVHGKSDVTAVEMAAMQNALAGGIDDRVVGGAVELILDKLTQPGKRVGEHADHVRRATNRVAVLQAFAVQRRALARQIFAQPRGHALLTAMGLYGKKRLVEMLGVAIEREGRQGGNARR